MKQYKAGLSMIFLQNIIRMIDICSLGLVSQIYYLVEDQLQMGQNEENFWYASFLGRTSQKNYPVNTCAMRVHYNTAGPE